jgi:hypothetical protein
MTHFPHMAPADFVEVFAPALQQYLEDVYGSDKVSHPEDLLSQTSTFFDVSYYSISAILNFIDYTGSTASSAVIGGSDEVVL